MFELIRLYYTLVYLFFPHLNCNTSLPNLSFQSSKFQFKIFHFNKLLRRSGSLEFKMILFISAGIGGLKSKSMVNLNFYKLDTLTVKGRLKRTTQPVVVALLLTLTAKPLNIEFHWRC